VTTDDILETRKMSKLSPRDNVMLELGLFSGSLGQERAIMLVDNDSDLKLPSDLNGITQLRFSDDKSLNDKINEISTIIDTKGRLFRMRKGER